MSADVAIIGVISDTHGLLRPEAVEALQGVDLIIHGGDIGSAEVIAALEQIAPVIAVRGNVDTQPWAEGFPSINESAAGDRRFYVLHNIRELEIDPAALGYHVVVYGHSHKPSVHSENGVLYVNPGSAGRRRFKLPISVAKIEASAEILAAKIIELPV